MAAVLLFVSASCVSRSVDAVGYHVCDCGEGATAGCANGDDGASGLTGTSPWRSYERARQAFAGLQPGDGIRFCRGGAFALGSAVRWVNAACRADARCTIEAYLPPGGDPALPRPRLNQVNGGAFGFDDGGTAEHEEGYVLRDLDLRCTDCSRATSGIFFYNDIDDVQVERVSVRGFGIGIYHAGSQGCTPGAANCDGLSSRITISDVDVRDSLQHGYLGAGDDLTIEDSRFENNGSDQVLDHNMYLGGNASRLRILRNSLYRSAALTSGTCRGSSFAAHGNLAALLVEGNLIREDVGAATGNCWGIDINPGYQSQESFHGAVVRGNTILNVGTAAIALGACVDCVIENNVIVHAQPHAVIGIRAPASQFGPGDVALSGLVVRNNSIHIATSNSVGIAVGGEGDGHVVVANAIESVATSGSWSCLSLDLPATDYASVDHNVCGYVEGNGRAWEAGSGALAAWRAASNFDMNSVFARPGFAAAASPTFDLSALDADAAMVGRGDPVLGAPNDFFGDLRGAPPDAGAYQWTRAAEPLFRDGFEGL